MFVDEIFNLFAPHICKNCDEVGSSLCNRCIYYISNNSFNYCLLCLSSLDSKDSHESENLCAKCAKNSPFSRAFAVGFRENALQKLVDEYKFNSERGSAKIIAKLLHEALPRNLPTDINVVPLTTVSANIRSRGFDHTKLFSRKLARMRHLTFSPNILIRTNNLTQHFLENSENRRENAEKSFAVDSRAKIPEKILLVDDILTTGSTVNAAANLLLKSGAKEIWLAIVARQPNK